MTFRISSIAMALTVSLWTGCSKQAQQESGSAAPKVVDLGVVELSYSAPSRHDLGGGAVCIITAETMDAGNIEISAIVEKSGRKPVSTRALPVRIGLPLELSFGDVQVRLTPRIK